MEQELDMECDGMKCNMRNAVEKKELKGIEIY